jgi:hypothetical protein
MLEAYYIFIENKILSIKMATACSATANVNKQLQRKKKKKLSKSEHPRVVTGVGGHL